MKAGPVARANRWMRQRLNVTIGVIPLWLVGMFVTVAWIAPFVWTISTSLKPASQIMTADIEWLPREVTFDSYVKVFEFHPILRWLLNSVIVAGTTTTLCVLFSMMAGYAFTRLHFPGRDVFFAITLGSIMIPAQIALIPLYMAFLKLGFMNSYPSMIAPGVVSVVSVYIFRQFFMSLPGELEDAAFIDGLGRMGVFWRIAVPLARAPLVASAILAFTGNWNGYLWPLLMAFEEKMKTLAVGIAVFAPGYGGHSQLESFGPSMAAVTILSMPMLIAYLFLQRYFVEGMTSGSIKG